MPDSLTIPDAVLSEFRGLASLSPGVVPCRGLRPDEWRETHQRCQEFVERWGMQAHAAGWDTISLFGVSPDLGTIRGDFCGALMPFTRDVSEVTSGWIRIGSGRKGRHQPVKMPGMVPIWEARTAA